MATIYIWRKHFATDCWVANDFLSCCCLDNLPDGNSLVNLGQKLNILLQVDVCGPLMCNSKEQLGEQVKRKLRLVRSVHQPLLLDLPVHFTLFVEWQEYSVNSLHQSFVLVF